MRKRLAALLAMASLALVAIPSPAHAVAGSGVFIGGSGAQRLILHVTVTGVITGPNSIQVVLECDAEAVGAAASTAINQCTASSAAGGSATAPNIALPGNFAATAGTNNVGLGIITVCGRATATWLNSSTTTTAQGCVPTII